MVENNKDNINIIGSEIIIYQTEDGDTKLTLNLKMRPFGLRRHNYVNFIKLVNLISVSILNTFLKRVS